MAQGGRGSFSKFPHTIRIDYIAEHKMYENKYSCYNSEKKECEGKVLSHGKRELDEHFRNRSQPFNTKVGIMWCGMMKCDASVMLVPYI